jgi:hypothetical protein
LEVRNERSVYESSNKGVSPIVEVFCFDALAD